MNDKQFYKLVGYAIVGILMVVAYLIFLTIAMHLVSTPDTLNVIGGVMVGFVSTVGIIIGMRWVATNVVPMFHDNDEVS